MSMLKSWRELLNKAEVNRDKVKADLSSTIQHIERNKQLLEARREALAIITEAAKSAQEQVSGVLESVVTSALQIVNGPEYEFKINFVVRRNSTEADMVLLKRGHEVDPLGNSGLGVANIIAIALRAAFILLEQRFDRVLVLDEPTAALMIAKQALAGEVLQKMCKELGFQIILTTHSTELAECGDKIYHVFMDNKGISKAREVTDRSEIKVLMEA